MAHISPAMETPLLFALLLNPSLSMAAIEASFDLPQPSLRKKKKTSENVLAEDLLSNLLQTSLMFGLHTVN